ncbi:hypothetical protein V202x_49290 [Gimesia aquarii]|uniref:Carboxypeptidase regulatory-like domain-containing protein n=2 Tax=Gimesia aquarii TaxID=2527964 RepID=A0A517X1X7_9PLAN|nr:hypothetical protein V202x_49290 [Gimesia aquarii]
MLVASEETPMNLSRFYIYLVFGICLILFTACGGNSALEFTRAQVEGTVNYKGEPLEEGLIRYVPDGEIINGQVAGKPIFAKIEQGKYQIPAEKGATVGKNRVEVTRYVEAGKQGNMSGGKAELVKQIIPPKYNSHSILSVEIKEGKNTQDFDLK